MGLLLYFFPTPPKQYSDIFEEFDSLFCGLTVFLWWRYSQCISLNEK